MIGSYTLASFAACRDLSRFGKAISATRASMINAIKSDMDNSLAERLIKANITSELLEHQGERSLFFRMQPSTQLLAHTRESHSCLGGLRLE
jgi:hypothetical protein